MADLVTAANVKAFLNITAATYDTFIGELITRASAFIEAQCGRIFAETTYEELYDGDGGYELVLDNYPLTELIAFSEDYDRKTGTVNDSIDLDDIVLQKATGVIETIDFSIAEGRKNIYVKYSAGYETTPPDISMLCIDLVARKFKESAHGDNRIGVSAKSVMNENVTFSFADMSAMHKDIIKMYARTKLIRGMTVGN